MSSPNADEIARWAAVADERAAHRCPELADVAGSVVARSLAALPPGEPPADLALALAGVAEARAAAGDGPGTATILDAIGLAFDLACPVPLAGDKVSYPIERQPTIELWHRLRALREVLPRCSLADGCPRCWDGRSCGTDELAFRPARASPRLPCHRGSRWQTRLSPPAPRPGLHSTAVALPSCRQSISFGCASLISGASRTAAESTNPRPQRTSAWGSEVGRPLGGAQSPPEANR